MIPIAVSAIFALLPFDPNASSGAVLYVTNCASCHGANGRGTSLGPSLVHVPAALTHFELDTGRMPAPIPYDNDIDRDPKFGQPDITAIADYVATFTPNANRSLPRLLPGNAERGRVLFGENCAVCHGAGGFGSSVGSDDVAPSLMHATTFVVAEAIRGGPGVMPRFGRDVLTDHDVSDIARYVNALQTGTGGYDRLGAGGFTLAFGGPVGEGIIAWLFGLGALLLFVRAIGTST
jgi:ubiquinol-cytochrome c reductase cytochrome c subunit